MPTTKELGFPQLEANTWTGIFAPAGTPDAGLNPLASSTREEIGRLVKEGIAHWTPLVKAAGITLE